MIKKPIRHFARRYGNMALAFVIYVVALLLLLVGAVGSTLYGR